MAEEARRSILIVEDTGEICDLLVESLLPLGIRLVRAGDGFEAMDLLKSEVYDAVLTDFHMPRRNGIELIEMMKHAHIETPVVMITGYPDQNLVLHALRLGAADFLEKPFVASEVREVMSRVVEIGFRRRRITRMVRRSEELEQPLETDAKELVARDQRVISLLQLVNRHRRSS